MVFWPPGFFCAVQSKRICAQRNLSFSFVIATNNYELFGHFT